MVVPYCKGGLWLLVCCPALQISAFFPGHHAKAMQQNAEMRKMEEEVQGLLAGGCDGCWC